MAKNIRYMDEVERLEYIIAKEGKLNDCPMHCGHCPIETAGGVCDCMSTGTKILASAKAKLVSKVNSFTHLSFMHYMVKHKGKMSKDE
jgi:hypothetical protein